VPYDEKNISLSFFASNVAIPFFSLTSKVKIKIFRKGIKKMTKIYFKNIGIFLISLLSN